MSLPLPWVDKIFDKLSLVYGHQFLSRWDGLSMDAVKHDWAHELSRFQQNPASIAYGLENLPERPPTVLEFRGICNSRYVPEAQPALDRPTPADPQRVAQELAKLAEARAKPLHGAKQWAFDLEARDRRTPKDVTPAVRAMYQDAIATVPDAQREEFRQRANWDGKKRNVRPESMTRVSRDFAEPAMFGADE